MTRPSDLHVLPVGARGDHRPLMTCECNPTQATEIMGGPLGRVIVVHRDLEPVPVLRRVAWHPLVRRDEPEPTP